MTDATRLPVSGVVRVNAYAVVSDRMEDAVRLALRRFFKHRATDTASLDELEEGADRMAEEIMSSLSEILDFGP